MAFECSCFDASNSCRAVEENRPTACARVTKKKEIELAWTHVEKKW